MFFIFHSLLVYPPEGSDAEREIESGTDEDEDDEDEDSEDDDDDDDDDNFYNSDSDGYVSGGSSSYILQSPAASPKSKGKILKILYHRVLLLLLFFI